MGKFSCLGIPAALCLLAADVSSMHDGDIIALIHMSDGDSSSNFGSSTLMGKPARDSGCCSKGQRLAGKKLKWIFGIVSSLLLLLLIICLGIFIPRHSSNTRPTVSDVVSNKGLPEATTTTSATGCYAWSGAYLEMETFNSSERENLAGSISWAKETFLELCLNPSSEGMDLWHGGIRHLLYYNLVEKAVLDLGEEVKKKLREIEPDDRKWACMVDVDSPRESIKNWVAAGSTALEEYNNKIDKEIKEKKLMFFASNKQLWGQAQQEKMNGKKTARWNDGLVDHIKNTIAALAYFENRKAQAPILVAEAIRKVLGERYPTPIEGNRSKTDIRMPSTKTLVGMMKVKGPIDSEDEQKIKRYEQKLLETDRKLFDEATEQQGRKQLWNDPNLIRIGGIIQQLTSLNAKLEALENQKEQEK